jgi:hypothetical protein
VDSELLLHVHVHVATLPKQFYALHKLMTCEEISDENAPRFFEGAFMAACVYLLLAFFAASGCEGRHAQPLPSFTIAAASREAVRPAGNVTARYATTTADVVPVARRPGIFKSIRQFFADWHNSQLARLLVTCCVYWMAFAP